MVIKSFTGKLLESDVWAMDKALRIKIVFQEYLENRSVQHKKISKNGRIRIFFRIRILETSSKSETFFPVDVTNKTRKATVFVTMLGLFRLELAQQYLWALAWVGLSMVPPFVVFKIVSFAQDLSTYNRNEALFYVAALLASIVVRSAGMFFVYYVSAQDHIFYNQIVS
jgi:Sec-independent protein secretion pathway component TatC